MLKRFYRVGFCLAAVVVFILPISGFSQDLGSSSGIFRSPNPSAKSSSSSSKSSSASKKSAEKPKSAAPKAAPKKETAKLTKTGSKSNKSSDSGKTATKSVTKPKTEVAKRTIRTESKPNRITTIRQPENNIIINVGQKTNGSFDELYEQSIEEGNSARDDRNYAKAETAYQRARSMKPSDSRAIYGLGNLFSDQQRWEQAESAYRQAITLEPGSPEAHIALSFVLTQPVVGTNLADRYTEAERIARKAIMLDENNAVAHDQLGVALELRGIIEQETQNAYRRAIQLDPNFALAYAHLGRLLRRNGLTNESSAAYRDAIRLASDIPTMILVAEVMQSQQRFVESEQLLRRALREDPKNPTALSLLGRALTIRGSYDEAERVLKTSLDVSPNSFVSYALLGSLYARRNKFDEAENILLRAVRVISINERRRLSQEFEFVGDGFMKIGKKTDAVRVYRQALALDGDKTLLTNKLNKAQKS